MKLEVAVRFDGDPVVMNPRTYDGEYTLGELDNDLRAWIRSVSEETGYIQWQDDTHLSAFYFRSDGRMTQGHFRDYPSRPKLRTADEYQMQNWEHDGSEGDGYVSLDYLFREGNKKIINGWWRFDLGDEYWFAVKIKVVVP